MKPLALKALLVVMILQVSCVNKDPEKFVGVWQWRGEGIRAPIHIWKKNDSLVFSPTLSSATYRPTYYNSDKRLLTIVDSSDHNPEPEYDDTFMKRTYHLKYDEINDLLLVKEQMYFPDDTALMDWQEYHRQPSN
ncbi:hypothetical protein [Hymenobacter sp. BT190]|uniref:hypothetical protein n=1 Tax=Hymenobacter sp. BT190 TaxID=2763505 RepID=UPI001650DD43|nr:hypothetical protein [Hymenobacter sp. BT190]MBC6697535.1 hypothetical protein [Hymenobacter sp. BT190]